MQAHAFFTKSSTVLLGTACALLWSACTPPHTPPPSPLPAPTTYTGAGLFVEPEAAIDEPLKDYSEELKLLDGNTLTGTTVRYSDTGILEAGSSTASTVLTVFTEHHCSYCREFEQDMLPRLQSEFSADDLRVRTVIFPLEKYKNSQLAARAFICAGQLDAGAQLHTALFESEEITTTSIQGIAKDLEIDVDTFSDCVKSEATAAILERQKGIAAMLDVTLVPTFFLNGEKLVGLPIYADMRGWIRNQLQ